MAAIVGNKLCEEICNAFGLKDVRVLEIRMAVDEIITIKAEFFPKKDDMEKATPLIKKFYLGQEIE